MSKTERDLAVDRPADALDDLFESAEFDEAFDAALEAADEHVPGDERSDHAHADTVDADTVDADTVDAADDAEAATTDVDGEQTEAVADTDTHVDDETEVDTDTHDDTDADTDAVDDEHTAADGDDDTYEFPAIVPATPDGTATDTEPDEDDTATEVDVDESTGVETAEGFVEEELHPDEVAEEILEELRRADIDGPQVEMAPQDDNTAARRRPRRAIDYDPAPVPIPARVPRVLARKPRVRKVTRVVRSVDPWSVFKIALVANLVLYVIVLTAGVLLWNVAHATGTVDNVERFFESFGWQSFEFNGGEIYHAAWIAGLFGVIGLTGFAVLIATLFNLITDLVGGVRFTVLEEEVIETRTSPLRRFVVRRPEPDVPVRLSDHSGAMIREAVVDDTSANERPSR